MQACLQTYLGLKTLCSLATASDNSKPGRVTLNNRQPRGAMQLDPAVAKTRPSNFSPVVLRMFGFTSCAELSNAHKSATKHDRNPTQEIPGPASDIWTTRQHRRSESETHTHTYLHKRTHTHTYMCACLSVCPSFRLSAYLSASICRSVSLDTYTYVYYVCKKRQGVHV